MPEEGRGGPRSGMESGWLLQLASLVGMLVGMLVGRLECAGLGHPPHADTGMLISPSLLGLLGLLGAPVIVVGMLASMPVWQCSPQNGGAWPSCRRAFPPSMPGMLMGLQREIQRTRPARRLRDCRGVPRLAAACQAWHTEHA